MAVSDLDFQPACPNCIGHGLARAVEIKNAMRTIRYECDTCGHRWDVTRLDSPASWSTKRPQKSS